MMHIASKARPGALTVLSLLAFLPGAAWAAGEGVVLAPHRAVYEMTLAGSRGGSARPRWRNALSRHVTVTAPSTRTGQLSGTGS